ncbi:MAG: formylmethanofuran dehydrogenase subunit region [Acidobacteria bacterium]|nr:formylmethanofuran dehydrogenase subunit region [Acidobacteriota bacterium]
MESIDELLKQYELTHGKLCPGVLLGLRMAVLGCGLAGIEDPRGADRNKLIVWIEIDRWLADAVEVVTGARLSKRTLKFLDYGKLAATFLNVETGEAVRIVALESSRRLADQRHPEIEDKYERQMRAYREAAEEELFSVTDVEVHVREKDLPGHPRSRVICHKCGEGVNDGREISLPDGITLCRPCVYGTYYQPRQKSVNSKWHEQAALSA